MTDVSSADRPWLVIIDMQEIFSHPDKWWSVPKFHEIIPEIHQLVEHFQDRTLVTRFVRGPEPQGSWVPYYQQFPFANVPGTDPIYDLVPKIAKLDHGDNLVTMTTFSKWGNEVHGIRAKTGKTPHLVLTGVATDCCVLSTAMQAAEAGAFVTVVIDACAGSSPENQLAAEKILVGYAPLIQIVKAERLLKG